MSEMSGDTVMDGGRPPFEAGDGVPRPQPTDPDGSVSAGWRKIAAAGDGGWSPIDDAGDDGSPMWRQC